MIGLEKSFQLIYSNTQLRNCETFPLILRNKILHFPIQTGKFPELQFPRETCHYSKMFSISSLQQLIENKIFLFCFYLVHDQHRIWSDESRIILRPHLQSQNVDIFFILTRKQLALVVTNSSNYFNIYALVAPLSTFRKQGHFWHCCGFSQVR